jgi:hypothetical protein
MSYEEIILREVPNLHLHQQRQLLDYLRLLQVNNQNSEVKTQSKRSKPSFGCGSVGIEIMSGFDDPIEDFNEYMV